jgi:hypothetical protein
VSSRCPPRTSPQRPGQGPRSNDLVSMLLYALILWFAWGVEVEVRPEGVTAPPFFAVGICLVLVLFFALGDLVIGDLIFAGFFAVVLSLLIVPDELPEDLDLPLAVALFVFGVLDTCGSQRGRYTLQPAAQRLRSSRPSP